MAESICELLSPADDLETCIPLDTYLRKYWRTGPMKHLEFKAVYSISRLDQKTNGIKSLG